MASEPIPTTLDAYQLRRVADLLDTLNSFEKSNESDDGDHHNQLIGLPGIIPIVDPTHPKTVFGYADASLMGEYLFTTSKEGS